MSRDKVVIEHPFVGALVIINEEAPDSDYYIQNHYHYHVYSVLEVYRWQGDTLAHCYPESIREGYEKEGKKARFTGRTRTNMSVDILKLLPEEKVNNRLFKSILSKEENSC